MRHHGSPQSVLLLGEEPRVIVTVARSLWRRGIPVDVATLAVPSAALRSRAIRSVVSLAEHREEPDRFLAAMLDQIEGVRYDMIVPCNDAALAAVSRFHAELSSLALLACPPPAVVNRVLVKALTLEAARACGVPVPRTYPILRHGDFERMRHHFLFPVIVKPRRKMEPVSFKVRRIESWEELQEAFAAEPDLGERCLIQDYCPGEGVGIEVLLHHGAPVFVFQHRRIKELPATGGVSVLAVAERPDPTLRAQALRLLDTIGWDGPAMVEFRRDPATGRTALMEINGRYWGSLP
ncbi:MAG TPA: hypothetical protein VFA38_06970, partial [Nitrospirales bacterium]|nr:hypothetical protein [Nitrospirales bacterium]